MHVTAIFYTIKEKPEAIFIVAPNHFQMEIPKVSRLNTGAQASQPAAWYKVQTRMSSELAMPLQNSCANGFQTLRRDFHSENKNCEFKVFI